jgi:SAM-dependent methyltransferase
LDEPTGEQDPTERFSGLAEGYARYRPDYPREAIDTLLLAASLKPGCLVVDVGCGTGISSRLLADRGLQVVGVEPNESMLEQARQVSTPRVRYVRARGEETGLPSGSIDAVVCAQSFHWLDANRALAEFHRLLLPGRWVALLWNERANDVAATRDFSDIITRHPEARRQEQRRQQAGQALVNSEDFEEYRSFSFPNEQRMSLPALLGRAFSMSYAPVDAAGRSVWKEGLTQVFSKHAREGLFCLSYETTLQMARRRGRDS